MLQFTIDVHMMHMFHEGEFMIYFAVCLVTTKREGAATRLQERLH